MSRSTRKNVSRSRKNNFAKRKSEKKSSDHPPRRSRSTKSKSLGQRNRHHQQRVRSRAVDAEQFIRQTEDSMRRPKASKHNQSPRRYNESEAAKSFKEIDAKMKNTSSQKASLKKRVASAMMAMAQNCSRTRKQPQDPQTVRNMEAAAHRRKQQKVAGAAENDPHHQVKRKTPERVSKKELREDKLQRRADLYDDFITSQKMDRKKKGAPGESQGHCSSSSRSSEGQQDDQERTMREAMKT